MSMSEVTCVNMLEALNNGAVKTHAPIIPGEFEQICFNNLLKKLVKLFDGTFSYEKAVYVCGGGEFYCLLVRKTSKILPEVQFAIILGDCDEGIHWEMSPCSIIEGHDELFFVTFGTFGDDPKGMYKSMVECQHGTKVRFRREEK